MTRKDYQLIAGQFKSRLAKIHINLAEGFYSPAEARGAEHIIERLAFDLAVEFDADNPDFSTSLFLEACGVEAR